jgi:hypothetical protein
VLVVCLSCTGLAVSSIKVLKVVIKVPFPHSGRLFRKFLPPQCHRGGRK